MTKAPEAFRSIGEVSRLVGVAPHVLRYWEGQFTQLSPVKRADGRRYYRPEDIKLVAGLCQVLRDEGLSIRGAKRLIAEDRGAGLRQIGAARLGEATGEGASMAAVRLAVPEVETGPPVASPAPAASLTPAPEPAPLAEAGFTAPVEAALAEAEPTAPATAEAPTEAGPVSVTPAAETGPAETPAPQPAPTDSASDELPPFDPERGGKDGAYFIRPSAERIPIPAQAWLGCLSATMMTLLAREEPLPEMAKALRATLRDMR